MTGVTVPTLNLFDPTVGGSDDIDVILTNVPTAVTTVDASGLDSSGDSLTATITAEKGAKGIRVRGSHFLWKMVRRLVGVLAAVGRGEVAVDEAAAFLDPSRTTDARATAAALAAPAAGLFPEAVRYKGDPPIGPLRPLLTVL